MLLRLRCLAVLYEGKTEGSYNTLISRLAREPATNRMTTAESEAPRGFDAGEADQNYGNTSNHHHTFEMRPRV